MSDPPEHDAAPPGDAALRSSAHARPDSEDGDRYQAALQPAFRQGQGQDQIDIVDDYAYPVPVTVICKILGVPLKDEPKFHAWIHDFMAGTDMGPDAATKEGKARTEKGKESTAALMQYLADLIKGFIKQPSDAMLSKMVNDDGPDGKMTPKEAVANALLLLIAGHDSTVNTIAHCVLTLLRNPGSLELLRSRPGLIPSAIEEVLRLESAVQFFPSRSATADIEIGGTVIPEGSAVHLMYGAANRDPKRFPNPNKFDPERRDNEHFGWGSGIHTCFGGPLARLEVNLALETFLRPRGEPTACRRPAPVPAEQCLPRPADTCWSTSTGSETEERAMKAFQFVELQKPAQLREVPVPEPGPGQVLIKIGGAGACHSDLHLLETPATQSFTLPFTLGHENAGWVEKLGSGATGFAVGDPVIVYGPWGCGAAQTAG